MSLTWKGSYNNIDFNDPNKSMVFPIGFPHGISLKLVLHIFFAPEKGAP